MSIEIPVRITLEQRRDSERIIKEMIKLGMSLNAKGYKYSAMHGPYINVDSTERLYILSVDLIHEGAPATARETEAGK